MPRDRHDPDPDQKHIKIPGGFRAAFAAALVDSGLRVKEWQGTCVICLDERGEERTLSLGNVYRRAQNSPREEWAEIINEFVRHMTVATQETKIPADLNEVADQVIVRIGLPFPASLGEGAPFYRAIGETGLIENLVIDHPQFMCYVGSKLIGASGREAEHWIEVGRANLRAKTPPDYLTEVGEGSGILLGCLGDAYDAARAVLIDDLLPQQQRHGSFVAVPTRDVLIVLPVTAESLVNVHVLKRFAVDNYKSRPYPISDEVFWIRGGNWHAFKIAISDKTIQVTPPNEFLAVLQELAPDESGTTTAEPDPL